MTKEISVSKGNIALIDDEDYERISKHKWTIHNNGYARRNTFGKTIYLHREIMNCLGTDKSIDHINRNKLDNRKSNLRICTHQENQWNKTYVGKNKTGFTGVTKKGGKWRAKCKFMGMERHIGLFNTPEEANTAYMEFIKKRGEFNPK